jgi:hypothetical protein
MVSAEWTLGQVGTRSEITKVFGGSPLSGGICPAPIVRFVHRFLAIIEVTHFIIVCNAERGKLFAVIILHIVSLAPLQAVHRFFAVLKRTGRVLRYRFYELV